MLSIKLGTSFKATWFQALTRFQVSSDGGKLECPISLQVQTQYLLSHTHMSHTVTNVKGTYHIINPLHLHTHGAHSNQILTYHTIHPLHTHTHVVHSNQTQVSVCKTNYIIRLVLIKFVCTQLTLTTTKTRSHQSS